MDILAYIDRFITSVKDALQSYDDCEGFNDSNINNETPLEYDEEVELIWLVSLAQY